MNKKFQQQFIHRCALLLESGISLSEALEIIIKLEKSKRNLKTLQAINESVQKGISLSRSIKSNEVRFDPTLLSMISSGEKSGILAVTLRQALDITEKSGKVRKKLVGALIYPTFIALATVGMTLFLVMYIFPKIIPLFSSMDIQLPLLTRLVQWVYKFLSKLGLQLLLILVIVTTSAAFLYKKNTGFRATIQKILISIPIVGDLIKKYTIASNARSIATLLDCGQLLPEILQQTHESTNHELYKKAWTQTQIETTRGILISTSLQSFPNIFPAIVPDMLSIGERTGSLSSMFNHISRMYEEELDEFVKQLGTIIEPVLMISMGLIVGSIALSIILPIYEITNHLQH